MRKTLARISVTAAILAAAFAVAPAARAQATTDIFSGFQGKSKDPVQVDAASLETYEENKQRISVFSGGVTVKRGNTLMKADTIKLFSAGGDATDANAFTRIEANGRIYVSSGDQTVTGETAVVDMKANTITIAGGVVLSQGSNVITGSRLIVNMTTGRARVEQDPGKQIRGVFSPGDANLVQKKPGQ